MMQFVIYKLLRKIIFYHSELEKFTLTIQKDISKLKDFYDYASKSWDLAYEYSKLLNLILGQEIK